MGNSKHLKKPKAEGKGRLAAPLEPTNNQQLSPVFCLRHLKAGYTLADCGDGEAAAFVRRLKQACNMTWDEIDKAPRKGLGVENMPKDQIRGRYPERVTDEVKKLQVMRFSGDMARIIGLRIGRVFEVYYVDHSGSAYDHGS